MKLSAWLIQELVGVVIEVLLHVSLHLLNEALLKPIFGVFLLVGIINQFLMLVFDVVDVVIKGLELLVAKLAAVTDTSFNLLGL